MNMLCDGLSGVEVNAVQESMRAGGVSPKLVAYTTCLLIDLRRLSSDPRHRRLRSSVIVLDFAKPQAGGCKEICHTMRPAIRSPQLLERTVSRLRAVAAGPSCQWSRRWLMCVIRDQSQSCCRGVLKHRLCLWHLYSCHCPPGR